MPTSPPSRYDSIKSRRDRPYHQSNNESVTLILNHITHLVERVFGSCIEPYRTVRHSGRSGMSLSINSRQPVFTKHDEDMDLESIEQYKFYFPPDASPAQILAAASNSNISPTVCRPSWMEDIHAKQCKAQTSDNTAHKTSGCETSLFCPFAFHHALTCSPSQYDPENPAGFADNISDIKDIKKDSPQNPKEEETDLRVSEDPKLPKSEFLSPKLEDVSTPPSLPATHHLAVSGAPAAIQSTPKNKYSRFTVPSYLNAHDRSSRSVSPSDDIPRGMLIDQIFIENAKSGGILYVHKCRWDHHCFPCHLWIGSDRNLIGKHMRTRHGIGTVEGPTRCSWEGCGYELKKGNISAHIVSIHLSSKSSMSQARMIDVGQS
ncbi:hypothetical protein BJ138DRAFT_1164647 [Hygrophoropsis aurantiaca]|uniref:Uncharacterized protein n=1 Tax=Hygrophoropsis aurantiaca TaxID=72124 RepID=A0ACB7ZWJ2_9AGAM|nr:hypothetical protein BJ138DRAFT_1164647 [Hygrophoropsis aurantiaca]